MNKRWLAFLLTICLLAGGFPGRNVMADASDTESAITHQHTDSCYRIEEHCIHTHTEECYPTEEAFSDAASPSDPDREPTQCTHVCSEESGCIQKILDCPYAAEVIPSESPDNTGETTPDITDDVPAPECICTEPCTEGQPNPDCPVCKQDITNCAGVRTDNILITGFEDLAEEIATQSVPADNPQAALTLPDTLTAFDSENKPITIKNVTWPQDSLLSAEAVDPTFYTLTAKLPEGYEVEADVPLPQITVNILPASGTQILFENGIHYIYDPDYPDKKLTLFCMNNKLHWPHHTEDMGDTQVPGYTEGYLTPDDFESQKDYNECMRRLSKLLYAGYPYNGEHLYKIVANSSEYAPTEAEFNKMLIVPPVLQTAYPFLGHHDFTYADWSGQNKEHLEYLRKFTGEVIKLSINHGTTSNGLTYDDIDSMPFYRAAFSITNCNNQTPLEAFQTFYGASYFVTEEEAYNATQNAVWHLLHEYNIPDNDINELYSELAKVL